MWNLQFSVLVQMVAQFDLVKIVEAIPNVQFAL